MYLRFIKDVKHLCRMRFCQTPAMYGYAQHQQTEEKNGHPVSGHQITSFNK